MSVPGKLYLLPAPLGADNHQILNTSALAILRRLSVFISERPKTTRQFLKSIQTSVPFPEMEFFQLNKHTEDEEIKGFLNPAIAGQDVGLLSEAGCPGVADPGAVIVEMAHQMGIEVCPIVGPSSILLALMGSGMNGQHFEFVGYLPIKSPDRKKKLTALENQSMKQKKTFIFIETPYRNNAMIEDCIQTLSGSTKLCVAANLTLPSQWIKSMSIENWRKFDRPDLHKQPAVFLIDHPAMKSIVQSKKRKYGV